jgi:hypothetical protein
MVRKLRKHHLKKPEAQRRTAVKHRSLHLLCAFYFKASGSDQKSITRCHRIIERVVALPILFAAILKASPVIKCTTIYERGTFSKRRLPYVT